MQKKRGASQTQAAGMLSHLCHASSVRPLRLHVGDVAAEVLELLFGRGEGHDPGGHALGRGVRAHRASGSVPSLVENTETIKTTSGLPSQDQLSVFNV